MISGHRRNTGYQLKVAASFSSRSILPDLAIVSVVLKLQMESRGYITLTSSDINVEKLVLDTS